RTCPTPPAAGTGAGELGGIEVADAQSTGLRGEEPGESSARRGLARPRFADAAGGGAAGDGEADVLDADDLVLGAVEDLRECGDGTAARGTRRELGPSWSCPTPIRRRGRGWCRGRW